MIAEAAAASSEAELLRRGVHMVLEHAERPRQRLGVGPSRDGRSARETDDLLRESGFAHW